MYGYYTPTILTLHFAKLCVSQIPPEFRPQLFKDVAQRQKILLPKLFNEHRILIFQRRGSGRRFNSWFPTLPSIVHHVRNAYVGCRASPCLYPVRPGCPCKRTGCSFDGPHPELFALFLFYQNPSSSVADRAAIVCTHAFLLRVLARDPSPYAKLLRNVQVLVVDEANETCLTDFRAYRRCWAPCLSRRGAAHERPPEKLSVGGMPRSTWQTSWLLATKGLPAYNRNPWAAFDLKSQSACTKLCTCCAWVWSRSMGPACPSPDRRQGQTDDQAAGLAP